MKHAIQGKVFHREGDTGEIQPAGAGFLPQQDERDVPAQVYELGNRRLGRIVGEN